MSALKRTDIDLAQIEIILISHLHGDHFGGLPFLILDAQFGRRERPLTVVGPRSVETRVRDAMELMFPGSSATRTRFDLRFLEFDDRKPIVLDSLTVLPVMVIHPSGAPAYALRVECGGCVIAYSGDTEWTDSLEDVARGSDLFICEAYFFEKKVRFHLDFRTVLEHLPQLDSRRVVLTHLSTDMLGRLEEVTIECAEDGKIVRIPHRDLS